MPMVTAAVSIKMQRQDVLLAAALTFQVPAAGVIRRLTSVDVGA